MDAIKQGLDRILFKGVEMRLIRTYGIFKTMNPEYAGHNELPKNLKAMLRLVSMMLPEFTMIAEKMLFSEGFATAKLYDCLLARHGNMLFGKSGSGKTVACKSLMNAQGRVKDKGIEGDFFEHTAAYIMNSLAMSNDKIYGFTSQVLDQKVSSHLIVLIVQDPTGGWRYLRLVAE